MDINRWLASCCRCTNGKVSLAAARTSQAKFQLFQSAQSQKSAFLSGSYGRIGTEHNMAKVIYLAGSWTPAGTLTRLPVVTIWSAVIGWMTHWLQV